MNILEADFPAFELFKIDVRKRSPVLLPEVMTRELIHAFNKAKKYNNRQDTRQQKNKALVLQRDFAQKLHHLLAYHDFPAVPKAAIDASLSSCRDVFEQAALSGDMLGMRYTLLCHAKGHGGAVSRAQVKHFLKIAQNDFEEMEPIWRMVFLNNSGMGSPGIINSGGSIPPKDDKGPSPQL